MKTKFSGILTLLLAFVVQLTFAQEKMISGTVSDESGLPLPGVNILVKGTTTGTQTDFDGKYSISAKSGDVLSFSYLGLKSKEVTVGASNTVNVTMEEDTAVLDEVVVTAFGIKREKRETTYQTQQVDEELLNQAQSTRAASALAGKVAGLQINVQSNGVNPNTQIILRGLRSIGQSNEALVVIDGSIANIGAFDDLNPNDIESLNVLKGATAAAIYGSDAANGALIVTTKKGKYGEAITVGVNTTLTFEDVAYMPDFQTEYGTGWQGAYDPIENTNWGPRFDGTIRQVGPTFADGTFQTLPYSPVKDNARDFFEKGLTTQNTVYFSGGNDTGSLYLSFGNQDTDGIIPSDKYKRTTLKANATQKLGKVELALNSSFFRDETNTVGNTLGSQDRTLYWFILNQSANIPISRYKDWRNDLYSSPDGYYNGYYQNPYYMVDTSRDTDKTNRLTGNFSASWDVLDWLNLTGRIGGNFFAGTGKEWRDAQTFTDEYTRPSPNTSFVRDSEFQRTDYTFDFLANANFNILQDLTLKTVLGASSRTFQYHESRVQGDNLSVPGLYDLSNAQSIQGGFASGAYANDLEERQYGYFADLTFGYKNWLFLNASGRYDFTSTLRPEDNSYFYPAIGLSAVLTDAFPGIKNNVLNYAKVTVSNSTVYNDLGAEDIIESFTAPLGFPFENTSGFGLQNGFIDANIKKEKINTTEFGLNLSFFSNRLTLDAAYYKTITTDNIVATTTPNSSGGNSYLTNIGELEGDGLELSLGATILKSEDFSWDMTINYSSSKTVVNKITDDLTEVALSTSGEFGVYAVVGQEFPTVQASAYYRDPNGNVVINPTTGNPISTTELSGDNPQSGLKNLGTTTPDYIIGLSSSINYKNFRLSTTFDYRTGHVYYAQGSDAMEFTGRSQESVSANRQDFVWPNSVIETSPGVFEPNTNIPVTDGRQDFWTDVYNEIKENYVRDATAVKLREVALSYNLPAKYLERTPIKKLSLGVVGRNLLTWLPKENRFSDPEFSNNAGPAGNAIGIGGYFQGPPTRTYGLNVNIEF
ncbi:SusC/RagA family TonB-linked outer membrane protein [Subsaxibacter sp. CAU 1640]|uniref:SusC/RagA family TonB-linked outer membrane protein n=1 Tax=Subsaxibacter sp. CAU 1640 TaxID=2933271 RepID=UPI002002E9FA|nr:SusC/RagA family TonB-linked outer membrane protein [Subsaxibacter sp. CAU 1640]MCK7591947.1 SusC/RagA family TonB-linked outer membrane protein [Subsaxibacter sp. CAU 1640]